jgi:hypothetical protein
MTTIFVITLTPPLWAFTLPCYIQTTLVTWLLTAACSNQMHIDQTFIVFNWSPILKNARRMKWIYLFSIIHTNDFWLYPLSGYNHTISFLEFISRCATSDPIREETIDTGTTDGSIVGIKS